MRVLVTGATGFIGAPVARHLVDGGHEVVSIIRPTSSLDRLGEHVARVQLVTLPNGLDDSTLASEVASIAPDACIHLAWTVEPGRYVDTTENIADVRRSLALLEALDRADCPHFVGIGTCLELDTRLGELDDDAVVSPQTLYAASKHGLATIASAFQRTRCRRFTWGRVFFQYGPFEDRRRLVPSIVTRLLVGQPCPLSTGEQIRDYLHVDDVARAIVAITVGGVEGTVNIGGGAGASIATIAHTIARIIGRPDLLRFGAHPRRSDDPHMIVARPAKLCSTGWSPRYDLVRGLEETVSWWRDHQSATKD
jgi:nucleoside-diphosphate-sugar epimerase